MSDTPMIFRLKRNNEIWILSNADVDTKKGVFTLVPILKKPFIEVAIYDDTPSAHPTLPPPSLAPSADDERKP